LKANTIFSQDQSFNLVQINTLVLSKNFTSRGVLNSGAKPKHVL
jgi:hypothetical protein